MSFCLRNSGPTHEFQASRTWRRVLLCCICGYSPALCIRMNLRGGVRDVFQRARFNRCLVLSVFRVISPSLCALFVHTPRRTRHRNRARGKRAARLMRRTAANFRRHLFCPCGQEAQLAHFILNVPHSRKSGAASSPQSNTITWWCAPCALAVCIRACGELAHGHSQRTLSRMHHTTGNFRRKCRIKTSTLCGGEQNLLRDNVITRARTRSKRAQNVRTLEIQRSFQWNRNRPAVPLHKVRPQRAHGKAPKLSQPPQIHILSSAAPVPSRSRTLLTEPWRRASE